MYLLSLWYLRQAWFLSSASKYHRVIAYLVLYAGWTSCGFLLSDQKNSILSKRGSISATWSRQPSGNILKRPPFCYKRRNCKIIISDEKPLLEIIILNKQIKKYICWKLLMLIFHLFIRYINQLLLMITNDYLLSIIHINIH